MRCILYLQKSVYRCSIIFDLLPSYRVNHRGPLKSVHIKFENEGHNGGLRLFTKSLAPLLLNDVIKVVQPGRIKLKSLFFQTPSPFHRVMKTGLSIHKNKQLLVITRGGRSSCLLRLYSFSFFLIKTKPSHSHLITVPFTQCNSKSPSIKHYTTSTISTIISGAQINKITQSSVNIQSQLNLTKIHNQNLQMSPKLTNYPQQSITTINPRTQQPKYPQACLHILHKPLFIRPTPQKSKGDG